MIARCNLPVMDLKTAHALVRFGMGLGGGEPPPADPSAWLLNQMHQPDWQPASTEPLPSSEAGLAALRADREDRQAARQANQALAASPPGVPREPAATRGIRPVERGMSGGEGSGEMVAAPEQMATQLAAQPPMQSPVQPPTQPPPGQARSRALYRAQGLAAVSRAVATQTPFRERLVWFWTNHFTISLRRGECAALAGAFVQEAIRPYITGKFEDMVLAVMRHPAMLLYLDNAGSVGPDSTGGMLQHRGLNENLARECMELHTVTPASGYTQSDVTAFARILTGWSIEGRNGPLGFMFRPRIHEPGVQTVMGRDFPDGEAGGVEALRFLANHPATHRALATKLVCHFVSDTPPPAAVRRVEGILRDTNGNLGAAAAGLVRLEEAWTPSTKVRTPLDLVVASFRALDVPPDPPPPYLAILAGLGQPLWTAPAPNGWSDNAADWTGPESMMRRIDWAFAVSGRIGDRDPAAIAEASLGPLFRPATQDAMAHAGSRREALALLLTSPEFQRR
jgi:uncharacterized protein (DUF1800 family)